jgi:hypothetical protein
MHSSDLEMAYDAGLPGKEQAVGLRFNGMAIPPFAKITSAHVQFHVDELGSDARSCRFRGNLQIVRRPLRLSPVT